MHVATTALLGNIHSTQHGRAALPARRDGGGVCGGTADSHAQCCATVDVSTEGCLSCFFEALMCIAAARSITVRHGPESARVNEGGQAH